jgi:2-polyprenyl-6-hydroxyphenyl methylase/3-demethylubiquinone-9 3-methyltransferase
MGIGPIIRRSLGPLEKPATNLYRGCFISLRHFIGEILALAADARKVLEVGCGEGAVLDRLSPRMPEAQFVGIDIAAKMGRQFEGDATRVRFERTTIQDYAKDHPQAHDLAIVCDVLHHVPWAMHEEFLRATAAALKPGTLLLLKDWERKRNLIHPLCYAADRFITGDRVRYRSATEFEDLLKAVFPGQVEHRAGIRPWSNNRLFAIRI